jgi:Carboxypeptidase regulatory-like domain
MRTRTSVALVLGVGLALIAEIGSSVAATLKGVVRDDATGEGLGFVGVKVVAGTITLETETKSNGEYSLTGLPAGPCTLEFRKPGYEYFPTRRLGKIPSTALTVEDVLLLQQNADNRYFQRAARRDVERLQAQANIGGAEARREAYGRAWARLEDMNIEPAGRAAYAQALTAQVPGVVDLKLPKLLDYAAVNPDALRRVHEQTVQALTTEKPLPDKKALKQQGLSDVVIADVAVSTLKRSTTSDAKQKDFVAKFQKSYGDATANTLTKALSTFHGDDKTSKVKKEGKESGVVSDASGGKGGTHRDSQRETHRERTK